MQASFSPPCSFLEHRGQPTIDFRTWIRSFENYILAAFPGRISDERKRAVLLNFLGTEGLRRFYCLKVQDDTYDSAVKALTAFFTPKVNVCVERYRFRKRTQEIGEPVDFYVADLKELAATCAFGTLEDELVRDQLIGGTSSAAIREKLLAIDDLTLEQAITITRQMETAKKEASCLHGATDTNDVNAMKLQKQPPSLATETSPLKFSPRPPAVAVERLAIWLECADRNRSSRQQEIQVQLLKFWKLINDCCCSLDCLLDTGSPVSIIPLSLWERNFPSACLQPPRVKLTSYCKQPVPIVGCFEAQASLNISIHGSSVVSHILSTGPELLANATLRNYAHKTATVAPRSCFERNKGTFLSRSPSYCATVFSALDLRSAYHQLVLHENSRDLTAFITDEGLFRFCRVPYGLCSAPSAFQKVMSDLLRGLPGVVCYLDDIVVFAHTA
uniref:Reverse transcriptase domain-containing protein n=1 Tax=Trichuris muris TaxID=70415 RepID=A0A5S6QQR1_TRIMR